MVYIYSPNVPPNCFFFQNEPWKRRSSVDRVKPISEIFSLKSPFLELFLSKKRFWNILLRPLLQKKDFLYVMCPRRLTIHYRVLSTLAYTQHYRTIRNFGCVILDLIEDFGFIFLLTFCTLDFRKDNWDEKYEVPPRNCEPKK